MAHLRLFLTKTGDDCFDGRNEKEHMSRQILLAALLCIFAVKKTPKTFKCENFLYTFEYRRIMVTQDPILPFILLILKWADYCISHWFLQTALTYDIDVHCE